MTYTIKELADLSGVTTRTLRFYDQIGLLHPAHISENGYRHYDHRNLLQLQQILFFRQLGVPLKDIQLITHRADFDLLHALKEHRAALHKQARRLKKLIATLEQTIATLQGEWIMNDQDYFEGFDEEQYAEEARQRWGHTPAYAESQRKWAGYSRDQKEAIKAEGMRIMERLVGKPGASPADPEVQSAVGDYYAYLNKNFYACEVAFLRNLADMWVEDPRFAVNYERIRQGGAAFAHQAVQIYCERNSNRV